jgi:uracil-DNA glycosylase family 4
VTTIVREPRQAPRDCPLCPRLVAFREKWREQAPTWHNAPVNGFGPLDAELLIVGLAPGLQGANRTGRPFTGDWAGDLLYATLLQFGFATGVYDERPDDGLELKNARIINAVRCVPPQNKPVGAEIATCRTFLVDDFNALGDARAVIALGRIAHDSILRALGLPASAAAFGHAAEHDLGRFRLFDSYHCSRYNTNTGRLTEEMFHTVFRNAQGYLRVTA